MKFVLLLLSQRLQTYSNQSCLCAFSLFQTKKPIVTLDTTREEDLAIDKQFTMQLIMALAESKSVESKQQYNFLKILKQKSKIGFIRLRDRGISILNQLINFPLKNLSILLIHDIYPMVKTSFIFAITCQ